VEKGDRAAASSEAQINIPFGHSFRIGETTEYLPSGASFEAVKQAGHWLSDAFRVDLRKETEILGCQIQAKPPLSTKLWDIIETVDVREYVVVSLVWASTRARRALRYPSSHLSTNDLSHGACIFAYCKTSRPTVDRN
jgi:hypothetical protein